MIVTTVCKTDDLSASHQQNPTVSLQNFTFRENIVQGLLTF